MASERDPSGMVVYPKLPVPSQQPRPSDANLKGDKRRNAMLVGAALLAAILGLGIGYLVAPDNEEKVQAAKKEVAAAQTAVKVEKDRADGIEKQLTVVKKDKESLEQKLSETTTYMADAQKKASDAAAAKLSSTIDKSQGTVSQEGEEIHLKLVDKVLFALGDDQLTPKGKAVLDKVGKALAELPDKQIWVQGHTDDQPIHVPPAPKNAKGKKVVKGAEPVPGPRFASNWELSAARALQVVHYLQDQAKIDPSRLAALAFGQYRPVSKSNKAANRRIEIVLYPHKGVIEKANLKTIDKVPPAPAKAPAKAAAPAPAKPAAPKKK